jgi:hypothetical protein
MYEKRDKTGNQKETKERDRAHTVFYFSFLSLLSGLGHKKQER